MRRVGFVNDRKGGAAPLLALGVVPLMLSVGAAVDYSQANAARTSMQAALDAAGLMLAKASNNSAQGTAGAIDYFNSNFVRPDVSNVAVAADTSPVSSGTAVSLSASASMRT